MFQLTEIVFYSIRFRSIWYTILWEKSQSIPNLASMMNIKPNLSYGVPWKTSDECTLVKSTISVPSIKKIKRSFVVESSDSHNSPKAISFPIIFAAIQALSLFHSTTKDQLTIGIVVGFANKTRLNNFTALPITLHRPTNWEVLNDESFQEIFFDTIQQLQQQVEEKQTMVASIYSITNIYDIAVPVNNYIDVLISGIPLCTKKQLSIDEIKVKSVSGTMISHTMPVHVLHLSDMALVHTTTHIRTNDVMIPKLTAFNEQINRWLGDWCHGI